MDLLKNFLSPSTSRKESAQAEKEANESSKIATTSSKDPPSDKDSEAKLASTEEDPPPTKEDPAKSDSVPEDSAAGDKKGKQSDKAAKEKVSKNKKTLEAKENSTVTKGAAKGGEEKASKAENGDAPEKGDTDGNADEEKASKAKKGDTTEKGDTDGGKGDAPEKEDTTGDEEKASEVVKESTKEGEGAKGDDENTEVVPKDENGGEAETGGSSDAKTTALIDIEDGDGDSPRRSVKTKRRAAKSILTDVAAPPSKRSKRDEGKTEKAKKAAPKKATSTVPKATKIEDKMVYEGVPTRPIKDGEWPKGWTERQFERNGGATKGRRDYYFYPPGKNEYKLRSVAEVKRYLKVFEATKSHEKAWEGKNT